MSQKTQIPNKENNTFLPTCGIIMPISAIDGCDANHWNDVKEIFETAIENSGFSPNLVSNSDESGIIHKRIIQNLYENPIVICDISGKNPNVMFELGMRLAFDKPTIIIKDSATAYSFDTSPIEHLEYPRDLRFSKIEDFQKQLAIKIRDTADKAANDKNYSTFLKHFGEFTIAKIDKKEISGQEYIIDELKSLRRLIESSRPNLSQRSLRFVEDSRIIDICLKGKSETTIKKILETVKRIPDVMAARIVERESDHKHLQIIGSRESLDLKRKIRSMIEGNEISTDDQA